MTLVDCGRLVFIFEFAIVFSFVFVFVFGESIDDTCGSWWPGWEGEATSGGQWPLTYTHTHTQPPRTDQQVTPNTTK